MGALDVCAYHPAGTIIKSIFCLSAIHHEESFQVLLNNAHKSVMCIGRDLNLALQQAMLGVGLTCSSLRLGQQ